MVQRKVPSKLALQPHHLKTETQHDLKSSKGSDLKKKMMKKSGSIKRPKHPGKQAATPNYMKPTTSSDARKEQSQSPVSTRDSSILRRKSLDSWKHGVSSGKKATKTLLARSLTKNPSFKPIRRCSTVVLCENLDAQRATCSSTLKDCKFPAYLSLNQGGTESEGTSAVKVCPYTYCSLNGHHHAPLPPLKCFLSARRRAIKTQRGVKAGCLSPRRAKPVGDGALVEEVDKDFFVEIYSREDEDAGSGEGQEQGPPIHDDSEPRDEISVLIEEERSVELLNELPEEYVHFIQIDDSEAGDEIPVLIEEERSVELLNELPAEDVRVIQIDDSEASDMEWNMGYNLSMYLDYDYVNISAIDMEPDPEAGGVGEFTGYEESMSSDAFFSSNDGECTDSSEEHSESSGDDDMHIFSETSFDDPSLESVPNDGAIVATEEQVPNLENYDEDIIASSTVDSGKEPHPEGLSLNSSEGDHIQGDLSPKTALTTNPKKAVQESDDLGCFNPRGPNFLPLELEPDGEKVDLRHQDLDERKNSEEWMVDYALRQVVTKLGPARKKKVALLVEAFEKVMPRSKFDLCLMHRSEFDQGRTLQACI